MHIHWPSWSKSHSKEVPQASAVTISLKCSTFGSVRCTCDCLPTNLHPFTWYDPNFLSASIPPYTAYTTWILVPGLVTLAQANDHNHPPHHGHSYWSRDEHMTPFRPVRQVVSSAWGSWERTPWVCRKSSKNRTHPFQKMNKEERIKGKFYHPQFICKTY